MITVYEFDPRTGRPTGESEYEYDGDPEDLKLMNPDQVWVALRQKDRTRGTIWKPPGSNYVWAGGWIDLQGDFSVLAQALIGQAIEPLALIELEPSLSTYLLNMIVVPEPIPQYSATERGTWSQQVEEALAGTGPLLELIAEAEQRPVQDLAASILSKHDAQTAEATRYVVAANKLRRDKARIAAIDDPEARLVAAADLARSAP